MGSLAKKLSEVMAEVSYVQKTGKNAFHGYKYATEADVSEKVRAALSKRSLIIVPQVASERCESSVDAKGKQRYLTALTVNFTILDGDSEESVTVTTVGYGEDSGDKGAYKAMTGATKYMMMKLFLIPTGDDPEKDTEERPELYTKVGEALWGAVGGKEDKYAKLVSILTGRKDTRKETEGQFRYGATTLDDVNELQLEAIWDAIADMSGKDILKYAMDHQARNTDQK